MVDIMEPKKKITIIGAGPGGYETALAAVSWGLEVVLVSDSPVGGVCLNEGCIPTKTFCRNAELLDNLTKIYHQTLFIRVYVFFCIQDLVFLAFE